MGIDCRRPEWFGLLAMNGQFEAECGFFNPRYGEIKFYAILLKIFCTRIDAAMKFELRRYVLMSVAAIMLIPASALGKISTRERNKAVNLYNQ